jgi:hypothetical protein
MSQRSSALGHPWVAISYCFEPDVFAERSDDFGPSPRVAGELAFKLLTVYALRTM